MTASCEICGERAVVEAYNSKWGEWQSLCADCRDRENPDKWESYKEGDDD